jgi:hypothetical protein
LQRREPPCRSWPCPGSQGQSDDTNEFGQSFERMANEPWRCRERSGATIVVHRVCGNCSPSLGQSSPPAQGGNHPARVSIGPAHYRRLGAEGEGLGSAPADGFCGCCCCCATPEGPSEAPTGPFAISGDCPSRMAAARALYPSAISRRTVATADVLAAFARSEHRRASSMRSS